jgi:hypothetical protein
VPAGGKNGAMRPAFRYLAGWTCAAVAATTVSWVAIRDVVATAAVGDPVPSGAIVAGADAPEQTGWTRPSATPGPTTVPSVSPSARERVGPSPEGSAAPTARPRQDGGGRPSRPPAPSATASGDYKGYVLRGGQVVVQMRPLSASLVTAVPAPGFETQTWQADGWFRVDFVGEERRSSIIVAFAGHAPVATITES